ncbi:unnamed protein product [Orchesella dallaii]|uniref:Uncharacterized protein n=1 Tax=Orchesella dallaii TaxID=48710 RepID=A0ABP1PLV5_9HEXA
MEEGKNSAPQASGAAEPEIKLEDDVINAILDGYNHPDWNLVDYQVSQGSLAGDNYTSVIYSLKINMENSKSGESLSLPLMLKVLPKNEFRLKLIRDGNIFLIDINMYKMVLPSLEKFQRDAGLDESEIITP